MATRCVTAGGLLRFYEGANTTTPSQTDTTISETDVRNYAKSTAGATPFNTTAGGAGAAWRRIPHIKSVGITSDITTPETIRTSDTGGKRIPGCGGSTSFNIEVTSYLDEEDWLYNYILHDPTDPGAAINPERWYVIVSSMPASGVAFDPEGATFFAGKVTAGGFSFDNESDVPQSVDWQITVTKLVFPAGETYASSLWGVSRAIV